MKTNRYIALSSAVILFASAFASCGKVPNVAEFSSDSEQNLIHLDDSSENKVTIEGLYEEVPFDYTDKYYFWEGLEKVNDDLFTATLISGSEDEPEMQKVITDSSFSDFVVVDYDTPEEIAEKENSSLKSMMPTVSFCDDGSFNVIWQFYDPDYWANVENYLGHYDKNGVLENVIKVDAPDTMQIYAQESISYGNYIYANSNNSIIRIDRTDGSVTTIYDYNDKESKTYFESFKRDNEGKPLLVMACCDIETSEICTYVYEIADCESLPEPLCTYPTELIMIYEGYGEYKYLKHTYGDYAEKLYGVRADGTEQLIIDWELSRLSYQYFCPVGNDEFVALKGVESLNYSKDTLVKLVKKDASSMENTNFLTVCDYYSVFRGDTYNYNNLQDSYHVLQFTMNCSNYTDEEFVNGLDELTPSEDFPDIIIFNNRWEMYRYANQGLLADMGEIMDNDPEYGRDAYVPNLLEIFTEPDNKIYGLPLSFYYCTLAVKPKYWDKPSWTLDEMISEFDKNEDNMCYIYDSYTRQQVLTELIANSEDLVDYKNKTSNFNSPEFIKILEFSNRFHDEISYNDIYARENYQRFGLDRTLVEETGEGYSYCNTKYLKGLGEDISLVGYPSDSGNGGRLSVEYIAAISESCTNKKAAYEYIKYIVSECGTEHLLSSLAERFENDAYRDVGLEYNEFGFKIQPLSKEEADMLKEEMLSCHSLREMLGYNFEEFVTAEADRYFSGEISSQEAAENIQRIADKFI